MMRRYLLAFLFITQFLLSQEPVDVLVDSLTLVTSHSEKARISQKIAFELKNTDWERALHYIDYAEDVASASNSKKVLADFYVASGNIYYHKDALDISLDYFLKAYEYYKDEEVPKKYVVENVLAVINARIENKEDALHYFKSVYAYQLQQKDTLSIAKTLNNLGSLYLDKQLDSSLAYFKKSLEIAKVIKDNNLFAYLYTNLGRCYMKMEHPEHAKMYFNQAIESIDKGANSRSFGWVYNEFSEYYLAINQIDSVTFYAMKAMQALDSIMPYSFENQRAVNLLYKAYLEKEDFKNASIYFEKYNSIRDTLNLEEKKVNVERLVLEQEFKSKEQIRLLKESKKRFQYYIFGLSLLALLLFLGILLLRNRNKLKRVKLENELIEARGKELDASLELKNKELIGKAMTEIHRTEIIEEILSDLKSIKRKAVKKETQQAIDYIAKRLERGTSNNIWEEFEVRFEQVHESFYKNLLRKHPDLTSRDKRLCALLKLNLTSKEIALITGQSFKSVENARTRLRKKLQITNTKTDLSTYLFNFS